MNTPHPHTIHLQYEDLHGLYCGDSWIPQGTPGSAGLDLMNQESVIFYPGDSHKVPLGIKVRIPEGHVGILTSRSSTFGKFGIELTNGVGVIDSDYRGEIIASFHRVVTHDDLSDPRGTEPCPSFIPPRTRIAQLLILPIPRVYIHEVENISDCETMRQGGFGSTG